MFNFTFAFFFIDFVFFICLSITVIIHGAVAARLTSILCEENGSVGMMSSYRRNLCTIFYIVIIFDDAVSRQFCLCFLNKNFYFFILLKRILGHYCSVLRCNEVVFAMRPSVALPVAEAGNFSEIPIHFSRWLRLA
jgi:hypothetical protein